MSEIEDVPKEIAELVNQEIDGGYHIKDRDDGRYCIDVIKMMYNWRIVRTVKDGAPDHMFIDSGWCMFGHGVDSSGNERTMETAKRKAIMIALVWDGYGDPPLFDKKAL